LYIGEYVKNEKVLWHPNNKKIESIIEPYLDKIKKIKKYNLTDNEKHVKISIIWILISIGEFRRKKMSSCVDIEQFIDVGISIINKETYLNDLDEYESLKLFNLIKILKEIDKKIFIKRLVTKDATASCFQHLIKVLGYKNKDSLTWCNLNSTSKWYDTYKYIIDIWKKKKKTPTISI